MTISRPQYCDETAFGRFADEVHDLEAEGALLRAAVAISLHAMPETDLVSVEDRLQRITNRVLARVRSDDPKALLSHAHAVLFDDEGFIGNVENYYEPMNSFIPAVLHTRRGIPITLGLIYKEVLERLGLNVWGTNLPGHFLVSVWIEGGSMLVDPFTRGRILSRDEAITRAADLVGSEFHPPDLLQPASNYDWLIRMLHNLTMVYGRSRQQASLAAMLELKGLLDGNSPGGDRA